MPPDTIVGRHAAYFQNILLLGNLVHLPYKQYFYFDLQVLRKIFEKLKPSDLLKASEVSKYWRSVAEPIIANSVCVNVFQGDDETKKFTIGYKHAKIWVSRHIRVNALNSKRVLNSENMHLYIMMSTLHSLPHYTLVGHFAALGLIIQQ